VDIMAGPPVRWMPLESNPEVMNKYISLLGVPTSWQFTDVFGLDPELLCMIPQPCCALILLFPITQDYYEAFKDEPKQEVSEKLFFMKQTIRNACGTIGVIHAVANAREKIGIDETSVIGKFLADCGKLDSSDKGKRLETDVSIQNLHKQCASEGQTAALAAESKVDLHFVALVQVDGCLYEFDGCKPTPVNHGSSSEETFVMDAARVCREFMAKNKNELRFTIVALSKLV
uniref:Ubiquitin carboxyl-terminal hydrolase n=2 Tax=Ciona intestinalis TaxID=7719 RepID=F6QSC7_CIOIN